MRKKLKKIVASIAAMAICTGSAANCLSLSFVNAAYGVGGNGKAIMEYLDRGIYAVKSGDGMFISWRYNANDSDTAEFRLYRDDKLIYTSKSGDPTCYQDNGGTASSKYRVDCLDGGKVTSSENCKFTSGSNYFDIKLNSPGSQYSPNDCCVGDVDGDGQYEIFLKWDPANAKDNSQEGVTDNVFIDCYTLTGKQLWRIDLGQNIRAGQHYTQMCVADFDCDGKAELITKTADGTKDGAGKVIGDASKKYANTKGYILDGPEYLTLFDGQTGKNLDTIDFPVPRGKVSDWGDNYGNRVDRMNSAIAYLDGVHPSAVYGRGYYTRLTLSAFDVQNKKLVKRWIYDTGNNKSTPGWGCGNHNVMVADVDDDGKQEVCMGASMIDDNGKLLWTTGTLHGDAMHLGDLIPDREGQELWICHEDKPYGESCVDAKTGKTIFHINGTKDTGRCAADNVYAGNKGAEFWGAADGNVYDKAGKKIGGTRPAQNFFIYWDGDLEREILDGNKISKMTAADKIGTIFTANGCSGNNSSKNVPCITADLFGDWREELIMRTSDNNSIRIWCTTDTTKVRLTTLMHDMQYRMQNGCQQSCYNQPPHVSYYLGSDAPLPARPKVILNNNGGGTVIPPTTTPPTTEPPAVTPVSNKFDLGATAQNGFTSVSATVQYDKTKGYGFSGNDVKDVAAAGKNELSDAVQFTGNTTFNVDLPNGLYKVKVTLGNTSRTSVYMENQLQIVNMTGNNAVDEILLPITDGQLNIRAAAGKSGTAFSISSIEIDKVSDEAVLPSTIWICGDSTVCNYYPLETSTQGGWGQMLGHYVDNGWNIRNMAASGSYAQAFMNDGNFNTIEKYGKAGDVYIISIGINDSKYYNGDEYKKIVTDMVTRAKDKGMEVILVKQQGRNGDAQKNPLLTSRWFASQLDQIGKEQNCQVVDLFNLWQDYCISVGADKTTAMYMSGDQLHPNRAGAEKLAELFASQFKQTPGNGTVVTPPTTNPPTVVTPVGDIIDGTVYTIKNVNSGMYLNVADAKAENGANIQQHDSGSGDSNKFKAVSAGNGYFYLMSQLGDGNTYALDVAKKSADNGTNISIYTFNGGDNQQFKLVKNDNGSYSIRTKISNDASCVEVTAKSKENGANVQEWAYNGGNNQSWYFEKTSAQQPVGDFILGDIDKDGAITVFDMVLIRKELVSGLLDTDGKKRADVNSDGNVSVADALELQNFILTGAPFSGSGNASN